jgi:hypothetical protein
VLDRVLALERRAALGGAALARPQGGRRRGLANAQRAACAARGTVGSDSF